MPQANAIEPESQGQEQRHPGRERDDERSDPGRRVLLADVQEQVIPDDDEQSRREHPDGIPRVSPGRPRARQRMYAKPGAAIA